MAWNVLQSAGSGSTGAATTKAVAFSTANLSSGTKIIAVVGVSTATGITVSVSDGTNSLTQCGFVADSTNAICLGLYAMDTPAGDVGTKPTITASLGASLEASILVLEVSGLAVGNTTAAMLDGSVAFAGFAAAASDAQPSYTSTVANEFLVSLEADNGGPQTVTQPTGYTLAPGSITNNANCDAALAYKNSTGGAESGTWTFGGTTTGTELGVVAFKVSGAGPPTSGPPMFPGMVSRPVVVSGFAGPAGANHSR